jgi:hypothetical protein
LVKGAMIILAAAGVGVIGMATEVVVIVVSI